VEGRVTRGEGKGDGKGGKWNGGNGGKEKDMKGREE